MFLFLQGDPGRGVYWLRKSDGPLVDHVVRGNTIRSQDDFTEWNVAKVDVAGYEANPPGNMGCSCRPCSGMASSYRSADSALDLQSSVHLLCS